MGLSRFGRTTWVKLAALLAVLTAFAAGGVFAVRDLPTQLTNWMIKTDLTAQSYVWSHRILNQLEYGETSFTRHQLTDADQRLMSAIPTTSDIFRIKFYGSDGIVFWSTRASDLGKPVSGAHFADIVAAGQTYFELAEKPGAEIADLPLHSQDQDPAQMHRISEIYSPILSNGHFLGAIEFYTNVTDVHAVLLTRIQHMLMVGTAAVLTLVALVTAILLRGAQIRLRELKKKNAHEREMLEQQMMLAREVGLLSELNEWLQSSRSLSELFDMVQKFMTYLLPECEGSIYVYSNSRDVLDGATAWNGGSFKAHIHPDGCWGLRRGRTYAFGEGEVDFVCEHAEPHDDMPYFCFPILAHGETVGLMHLKMRAEVARQKFYGLRKLAQMCAEQISMAVANVRMRDQLQDQSIRDPLTGLYNRRHMLDRLRRLLETARSLKQVVHLTYVDVDHFKQFNDKHGHDAGDAVLRAVAETLIEACEGDELACRMGGEEFMVIWPNLTETELRARAEDLRKSIAALTVRYGEHGLPKITISAGVATFPQDGTVPQDLLRAADEALYRAKDQGRNQVVFTRRDDNLKSKKAKNPPQIAAE